MPRTFYPVVEFKKVNPDAPEPRYARDGDAGMDLCSMEDVLMYPGEFRMVGSGIAAAIPKGFVGLVVPRSGMGCKGLVMKNGTGVIDSNYRGEIKLTLYNNNPLTSDVDGKIHVCKGDRVAQLLIAPIAEATMVEVEELDATARGENGFGSSGYRNLLRP